MRYVSTRGGGEPVDFETALLDGYAKDGGLYVAERLPELPWREWSQLSLPEIIARLLPHFMDASDVPLKAMLDRAYGRFSVPGGIRLKWLEGGPGKGAADRRLAVAELFHGPTWSFKDYSLIFLGELLEFFAARRAEKRTVVVATSGDTGSAAAEGLAGKAHLRIFVLYPLGRISEVQRRQMVTVPQGNVHPVAVDGDSDELDQTKEAQVLLPLYGDADMPPLGCVNSINWARVMVQMAHWFWIYFQLAPNGDGRSEVEVVVPTGACGNLMGGVYAAAAGLPVRLVAGTGPNDVVHRLVRDGELRRAALVPSHASAMDIQCPYNLERLFHLLSAGESALTARLMKDFARDGVARLPAPLHATLRQRLSTHAASDEEILHTVREVRERWDYVVCPHSATALHALLSRDPSGPVLPAAAIATASPHKFPDTLRQAIGEELPPSQAVQALYAKPQLPHLTFPRSEMAHWTAKLKTLILQ